MSDIKIATLYSGSKGNSTYIRMADTAILIDAGGSARRLCKALTDIGSDIKEIRAIFVTHDHSDHISALETLCSRHGIPIHMTERSASVYDAKPNSSVVRSLCKHGTDIDVEIDNMRVMSFKTPHDSLMSVGYRIEYAHSDKNTVAVGIATDIGHVTDAIIDGLSGCIAVVIESNHDVEMLIEGPYPDYLKKRILSRNGHLSNKECGRLCEYLVSTGTKAFILAHLSEENNKPKLALDETVSAIADREITVLVADAHSPTELALDEV